MVPNGDGIMKCLDGRSEDEGLVLHSTSDEWQSMAYLFDLNEV